MTTKLADWPEQAQLEENQRRLARDVAERILAFEAEFGMSTEEMEQALADGSLAETPEVASWLIAIETQRLLERAR